MASTITITATSKEDREAAYASEPQELLTFGFPAALTIFDFHRASIAYRDVLGQTSVKPLIAECMMPLWMNGHMRGDHRLEVAAFGPLLTDGVSFQWPAFDIAREEFNSAGVVPRSWNVPDDQMKDRRLGLRAYRVPILSRTISSLIWNRREAQQQSTLGAAEYEIVSDCPACQLVAMGRFAQLVIGDPSTYPPYFPGDVSSVRRKPRSRTIGF